MSISCSVADGAPNLCVLSKLITARQSASDFKVCDHHVAISHHISLVAVVVLIVIKFRIFKVPLFISLGRWQHLCLMIALLEEVVSFFETRTIEHVKKVAGGFAYFLFLRYLELLY